MAGACLLLFRSCAAESWSMGAMQTRSRAFIYPPAKCPGGKAAQPRTANCFAAARCRGDGFLWATRWVFASRRVARPPARSCSRAETMSCPLFCRRACSPGCQGLGARALSPPAAQVNPGCPDCSIGPVNANGTFQVSSRCCHH